MDTTAPSQGCRWGRSAEGAKRPTATSGASIPAGSTKKATHEGWLFATPGGFEDNFERSEYSRRRGSNKTQ